MPKRIQMSRQHPWRAENPDAIIVDRSTRWGNPFKIESLFYEDDYYGPIPCRLLPCPEAAPNVRSVKDRAMAVELYKRFIDPPCALPGLWINFHIYELRGHPLACWCALDEPCHADVLLELANGEVES